MTSVVADTHTLIWYIFDLPRRSPAALTVLEQAVNGEMLSTSLLFQS